MRARERRKAFILTILHTLTRQALHRSAALGKTGHPVTTAGDHVVQEHL